MLSAELPGEVKDMDHVEVVEFTMYKISKLYWR